VNLPRAARPLAVDLTESLAVTLRTALDDALSGAHERRHKVKLRDALWALGYLSDEELLEYVGAVLAEIRSDEP
jgi:hypothetical protein